MEGLDDIPSFAGEYAALRRQVRYAKIWYDRETGMIKAERENHKNILYMTKLSEQS